MKEEVIELRFAASVQTDNLSIEHSLASTAVQSVLSEAQ
jgi:hypothetical protein